MYGTTLKFCSRGQRTVKVTLNVRPSATAVIDGSPSSWSHQSRGDRRNSRSSDKHYAKATEEMVELQPIQSEGCPIYDRGSHYKVKSGAQRYRRDQLVEMVQRSLAENLSFQNQRWAQSECALSSRIFLFCQSIRGNCYFEKTSKDFFENPTRPLDTASDRIFLIILSYAISE